MAENSNIGDGSSFAQELGGDENTPGSALFTIVNGATNDQTASLKRSLFGLDASPATYPTGTYWFGTESAQRDFVIPMARFKFYTPFGDDITLGGEGATSPELYIRMPGSFNSTLINSYATAQGIFGSPLRGLEGNAGYDILKLISGITSSALGSLQKQILDALTSGVGFAGSGGLNTRAQVEFLTRKSINNYNQVIYQGPQYRIFQLPFSMKPSSIEESNNMKAIIYCLRLASSARAGNEVALDNKILEEVSKLTSSGDVESIIQLQQEGKTLTAEQQQTITDWQTSVGQISDNSALDLARQTDVLTFGYPDMCKFQIVLVDTKNKTPLITLFKSDFCVITSVSVDYGSGNKMSFFDDYMPTEAAISLSLQEMSLPTAGSVANQFNNIQ